MQDYIDDLHTGSAGCSSILYLIFDLLHTHVEIFNPISEYLCMVPVYATVIKYGR